MAYSPEQRKDIQGRVLRGIAAGLSVGKCCRQEGMPNKDTIFEWLMDDETFSDQYARARERRADARVERIDDIAEEVKAGTLGANEARVIIDAEKWQAGKENSKRYGDKLDLTGDFNVKLPDEQVESRLAHLLRKAGAIGALGGTGTPEGPAQVLEHVPGDGSAKA